MRQGTIRYILFLLTPMAAACLGDEAGTVNRLEEVVVVATRDETTLAKVPYSAFKVSAEQLAQESYRTLPQALRDIPGIMVQETSMGQGSPYIRGFTGFRNLMLIDGVRLNNSVFREGPNQYWSTVDVSGLGQIEVVNGPASALYGTDAVGGVVNARSRDPVDRASELGYRYAAAENSSIVRGYLSRSLDESLAVGAGITGKDFGNLQGGRNLGTQKEVGYEEYDIDLKMRKVIDDENRIDALYQRVEQDDVPRTHTTIHAESWEGTSVGRDLRRNLDQERELFYVKLVNEGSNPLSDRATATLSWHRMEETQDRIRSNRRQEIQGFDVDTYGLTSHVGKDVRFGELAYGVDVHYDNVSSFASNNTIQGPVADDAHYLTSDLYLQHTLPLSQRAELLWGLRYSRVRVDADSVFEPSTGLRTELSEGWSTVAGNARFNVEVWDRIHVFGGVSQGFRAPNLSDLTRLDSARTNEFEVPSPGLDPEDYVSWEVGAKHNGEMVSAQLSVFYTDIEDMIIRSPTGRVVDGEYEVTRSNAGDGYVQGVELSGDYRVSERWKLFGLFAWQQGKVDTFPTSGTDVNREPIDKMMPARVQFGMRWDASTVPVWFEGIVSHAEKQDELSTADRQDTSRIPPGGTPGYTVYGVGLGWKPVTFLDLIVRVDNLGNEDYRIHGSGTNMPGRNVVLELRYDD